MRSHHTKDSTKLLRIQFVGGRAVLVLICRYEFEAVELDIECRIGSDTKDSSIGYGFTCQMKLVSSSQE